MFGLGEYLDFNRMWECLLYVYYYMYIIPTLLPIRIRSSRNGQSYLVLPIGGIFDLYPKHMNLVTCYLRCRIVSTVEWDRRYVRDPFGWELCSPPIFVI